MFVIENYLIAVIFCFVTMLCWGSWGNTQKLAAKSWRYELFYWDYVIGMCLFALVLAFTMGSFGEGGRPFLEDIAQVSAAGVWSIVLGGVIFNASNILLSASVSVAGLAVAFPLGVGISLVLGTVVNYIGSPKGDPALLFTGIALIAVAIVCNGIASGKAGNGTSGERGKGIALAVAAGVLMSFFYRFVARAMDLDDFVSPAQGMATPYTAIVIFSAGVLLSNFVFNTYAMKRPFTGTPVSYAEYFSGNFRTHLVGILGGAVWCLGTAFSYIASGKAGAAVSYALGQGAPMIAAVWGVFIWKEFRGGGKGVAWLLALMFVFYVSGLGFIIASGDDSEESEPVSLIFETDMGNDIDDALALAMIHAYIDEGKVNCLMVGLNKTGSIPAEYVDVMNTFYGHPDIPIGLAVHGIQPPADSGCYAGAACLKNEDGTPMFAHSVKDYGALPDAVQLYRKVLSGQPDNSVVIASVGFSTNLVLLLDTQADEWSPLTGRELVAKKVRELDVVAGSCDGSGRREYNVVIDIPAAQKLFSQWPTELVVSPWELGVKAEYPASSIENDYNWVEHHPYAEAYRRFLAFPYDRPSWDPTAVLYAVEGCGQWFYRSSPLDIRITDDGQMLLSLNPAGNRRFISLDDSKAEGLVSYLINLGSRKPICMQ